MPRRDGTGPLGMGPMTDRGAGFGPPGYMNSFPGRGLGRGRGYRRMLLSAGLVPGCAYLAYRWANRSRMK